MLSTFLAGCGVPSELHPSDLRQLSSKTVVVTGSSSGFGRGVALALGDHGANVVLAARRAQVLEQVAEEVRAAGGVPLVVTTDVSNPADVDRLLNAAISRFGVIDVWINNAGVTAIGRFEEVPHEDHSRLIDVNLKGAIYGSHAAMRRFRLQGFGTLVNVSSLVGEVPLAYQASYSASKAGILALGRALNEEIRLSGSETINVATIMPWAADTPIWMHAANYTGRVPCMPAMDDPQKTVEAIMWVSLYPREELAVGWKAQMSAFFHNILPDLTERISGNMAHEHFLERGVPVPSDPGNLHDPMQEGTGVKGDTCN